MGTHIPIRECILCRRKFEKKKLLRITKGADGIFADKTQKKEGRGAYICPDIACLEKAQKNKGLERSFKQAVPKEVYESLREELVKGSAE